MAGSKRTREVARRYVRTKKVAPVRRSLRNPECNLTIRRMSTYTADWGISKRGWNNLDITFSLGQLPNFGQITSMFELYRIDKVKVIVMPQTVGMDINQFYSNQYAQGTTAAVTYACAPRLYYAIDDDGSFKSTAETAIQSYDNARLVMDSTKPFSFVVYPKVQAAVDNGTGIVTGRPIAKSWIDTDNYNVKHYGCCLGGTMADGSIEPGPGGPPYEGGMYYQVILEYHVSLKGAKAP